MDKNFREQTENAEDDNFENPYVANDQPADNDQQFDNDQKIVDPENGSQNTENGREIYNNGENIDQQNTDMKNEGESLDPSQEYVMTIPNAENDENIKLTCGEKTLYYGSLVMVLIIGFFYNYHIHTVLPINIPYLSCCIPLDFALFSKEWNRNIYDCFNHIDRIWSFCFSVIYGIEFNSYIWWHIKWSAFVLKISPTKIQNGKKILEYL